MTHYTGRAFAYWGVFNSLIAVVLVNTLVSVAPFLTHSLYLSHILEKGRSCDSISCNNTRAARCMLKEPKMWLKYKTHISGRKNSTSRDSFLFLAKKALEL